MKDPKDEEFWVQVLKRSHSIEIVEGKISAEIAQVWQGNDPRKKKVANQTFEVDIMNSGTKCRINFFIF